MQAQYSGISMPPSDSFFYQNQPPTASFYADYAPQMMVLPVPQPYFPPTQFKQTQYNSHHDLPSKSWNLQSQPYSNHCGLPPSWQPNHSQKPQFRRHRTAPSLHRTKSATCLSILNEMKTKDEVQQAVRSKAEVQQDMRLQRSIFRARRRKRANGAGLHQPAFSRANVAAHGNGFGGFRI